MKQNITTQFLKANVGEVIDTVRLRGESIVIERRGKPVAALVPIALLDALEARRAHFFDLLDVVAKRTRSLTAGEMENLVAREIIDYRREKLKTRPNQRGSRKSYPSSQDAGNSFVVREDALEPPHRAKRVARRKK